MIPFFWHRIVPQTLIFQTHFFFKIKYDVRFFFQNEFCVNFNAKFDTTFNFWFKNCHFKKNVSKAVSLLIFFWWMFCETCFVKIMRLKSPRKCQICRFWCVKRYKKQVFESRISIKVWFFWKKFSWKSDALGSFHF